MTVEPSDEEILSYLTHARDAVAALEGDRSELVRRIAVALAFAEWIAAQRKNAPTDYATVRLQPIVERATQVVALLRRPLSRDAPD